MSEFGGPSPEEMGNPEKKEKDELFADIYARARKIVLTHPQKKLEDDMLGIEAPNVGRFGTVGINLRGETNEPMVVHIGYDYSKKEVQTYSLWKDRNISSRILLMDTPDYDKDYVEDLDLNARKQLLGDIEEIEQILQQRGEI